MPPPPFIRHGLQSKTKAFIDAKSKAEVGRGAPGFTARVPEFGRGVMMGVYVQDWMALDGGAQKRQQFEPHGIILCESCQYFLMWHRSKKRN